MAARLCRRAFDLEALLAPTAWRRAAGTDLREDYSPPVALLPSARRAVRGARRRARGRNRSATAPKRAIAAAVARRSRRIATTALTETEQGPRGRGLDDRGAGAAARPAGLTAGARLMRGPGRAVLGRAFSAARRGRDGTPRRAGHRAERRGGRRHADGQPLRRLPLFNRPDGAPFAVWQYERSERDSPASRTRSAGEQRIEAGACPLDTVENEARAARPGAFRAVARDALRGARPPGRRWPTRRRARRRRRALHRAASLTLLQPMLEIVGAVRRRAEETVGEADATEAGGAPTRRRRMARPAVAAGGGTGPAGDARGRAAPADEIADFFRRTEPHSPLSYTLEDAVRRGRMPGPNCWRKSCRTIRCARRHPDLPRHPAARKLIGRRARTVPGGIRFT